MEINTNFSKDKPMLLSTITEEGSLQLSKHVLNGRVKKNLKPQMKLRVESKPSADSSKPCPIPVISSKFSKGSESSIINGSCENPVFETVKIMDCPKVLILSRDKPLQQVNSSNGVLPKCGLASHKKCLDSLPVQCGRKRLPRKMKTFGVDLASPAQESGEEVPSTVNKCIAEVEDKGYCLNDMLSQITDDALIRTAVENIPVSSLPSFLSELHKLLSSEEHRYKSVSRKWLKETLQVHLSYLETCKDAKEVLHQLNKYTQSKRVHETLEKMAMLKGLLSIRKIQSLKQGC